VVCADGAEPRRPVASWRAAEGAVVVLNAGGVIAVVDYGIGNLRSAEKALEHLRAPATLTADPRVIRSAVGVVLPGVGAFGACMDALRGAGLEDAVRDAACDGRPFLGICVGMQMLYDASDESPEVPGLGILAGRVRRLPDGVTLPQMGWNTLEPVLPSRLLAGLDEPVWCYFVHSYAVIPDGAAGTGDPSDVAAWSEHGVRFAAAVERGAVWATQFHPEKSSATGLAILANFVGACTRDGSE